MTFFGVISFLKTKGTTMNLKKPKDEFDALPNDFKDRVVSSSTDELKAILAGIHKERIQLATAKRNDLHLQELKLKVDELASPYKTVTNANRLAIRQAAAKNNQAEMIVAILAEKANAERQEENTELADAKDALAGATLPYTESNKLSKLKAKYVLGVLQSKGGC